MTGLKHNNSQEGNEMKTKSMLTRILTAVAAVSMLAGVGSAHAGFLSEGLGSDTVHVGFNDLVGIVPASFPNFENNVKVKVLKNGNKGFKLKVRKKGSGQYFNSSDSESLKIKNGKYKLDAFFDTDGNFLNGSVEIKGKVETSAGKAKGTLMTATLGANWFSDTAFAYTSDLLGFNTFDIVCNSVINDYLGGGGCTEQESVIIALQDGGFDGPTEKGYKSDGLAVTSVPVPAAVWLFGSGLLGLVGVARRRRKH
jgi:hypothetical protein